MVRLDIFVHIRVRLGGIAELAPVVFRDLFLGALKVGQGGVAEERKNMIGCMCFGERKANLQESYRTKVSKIRPSAAESSGTDKRAPVNA